MADDTSTLTAAAEMIEQLGNDLAAARRELAALRAAQDRLPGLRRDLASAERERDRLESEARQAQERAEQSATRLADAVGGDLEAYSSAEATAIDADRNRVRLERELGAARGRVAALDEDVRRTAAVVAAGGK